MPNYCKNDLSIEGSNEAITRWMEAHLSTTADGTLVLDFNGSVPMPKELEGTQAPVEGPNQRLIELYGVDNWYDWCCKHWGTKWNALNACIDDEDLSFGESGWLNISYTTAWGPPEEWLLTMAKQYPQLRFCNEYCVEGELPCIIIEAIIIEATE